MILLCNPALLLIILLIIQEADEPQMINLILGLFDHAYSRNNRALGSPDLCMFPSKEIHQKKAQFLSIETNLLIASVRTSKASSQLFFSFSSVP